MTLAAQATRRLLRIAASTLLVAVITWVAFALHAKAFMVGFLYLLLVLPIAIEWGFIEATVASVLAIACLDFFFTSPLFTLYMSDPQDWIALASFEAVVLCASRLAARLRHQVTETAIQQQNVDRLYTMSRELLLLDRDEPVGRHIARLIVQIFGARAVALWNECEGAHYEAGEEQIDYEELQSVSLSEGREDNRLRGKYTRVLSQGSRMLGALCIVSCTGSGKIDWRVADAVASLAVLALDRDRAFEAKSNAEAARQNERLRSAVLDGLAHAYKTPLATIQAASSGLLEINRLDDVGKELANTIHVEAGHLADLTTQALQTARLHAGVLKVRPESVPIESFLRSDWSCLVHGLEHHPLEIDAGEDRRTVWADPRLLRMAVAQLLDNASKYSEPGTRIRMHVAVTGTETVFIVHNFGSYISPIEKERVFKRFYRSPGSSDRVPGTGIGLTVSKEIAEAHGGHIWIESDLRIGTTFYLGLPHKGLEE